MVLGLQSQAQWYFETGINDAKFTQYNAENPTTIHSYKVAIATPSANVLRLSANGLSMDLNFDKANGTIEIVNPHSQNWIQGTFLVQAW